VRRTGGADGSVSVAYETVADRATAGTDFGRVSGLLSWGDGDITEQQIRVPIVSDDVAEPAEAFRVTLRDIQGGAGLGTTGAIVQIAADGGPFGQFNVLSPSPSVMESAPYAELTVSRSTYSSGPVSVTLTPLAGTAAPGADFVADPITLTWADGEAGNKVARIPLVDDTQSELDEDFTVQLSNPTGGATVGPQSIARVRILDNDAPPPSRGAGAFDLFSVSLLGLLLTMRRFICKRTIERAGPDR
jgi:hypothetical protein